MISKTNLIRINLSKRNLFYNIIKLLVLPIYRSKVVTKWTENGGVLLLGYEMFRLLTTSRNTRSRKKKKKPTVSQPIDVDEEDRKSNLHKGLIHILNIKKNQL